MWIVRLGRFISRHRAGDAAPHSGRSGNAQVGLPGCALQGQGQWISGPVSAAARPEIPQPVL